MKHTKKLIGVCLFLATFFLLAGCEYDKKNPPFQTQGSDGFIEVSGVQNSDPNEIVYVRKAGHGPVTLVMISGSDTSGMGLLPVLQRISGIDRLNDKFTVYVFDVRGTGKSSYNTKLTSLKDCAIDIEKAMNKIENFPTSDVIIAGWSGGFGVAMELVIQNPDRYSKLVALAGISTRGHRYVFNNNVILPDFHDYDGDGDTSEYVFLFAGNTVPGQYAAGDWVPTHDDVIGMEAIMLHQRSFINENHTYKIVTKLWNELVFNDYLKYDIYNHQITNLDNDLLSDPNYEDLFQDTLITQNIPEFYYVQHKFNISNVNLSHTNSDGTVVSIPSDGRIANSFVGKDILLIKAKKYMVDPVTYYFPLRGDVLIPDESTTNSHNDFKAAGANATTVLIAPDNGYDHGFPFTHALEVINVIESFAAGELNATSAETIFDSPIEFYGNSHTF